MSAAVSLCTAAFTLGTYRPASLFSPGRGGAAAALAALTQPGCVIGIDSDVLYPLPDQKRLHAMLPNAQLHVLSSDHGHDGFLLEQEEVSQILTAFLKDG